MGADTLRLTAHRIGERACTGPGLLVAALPNVEHILIDALGRQHVVVRSGAAYMHIVISGQGAVIGPVALDVLLDQHDAISATAERLATLRSLLSAHDPALPPWTATTQRLRDALIALDGHRAGATPRETAAVIYGLARIDRDWPGKGLRHRLRRDLQRGVALCDGGYRDLLR
jgi:hypothetical protein